MQAADSSVRLVLPWPVSANRYWRSFVPRGHKRAIVTLSDDARAYKAAVARAAAVAGISSVMRGRVSVAVDLYPAMPQDASKRMASDPFGWDDSVRSIDLDNALKVLIDAIKGVVIDDDKWVRRIVAERMQPDGQARVELVVCPIAKPESPQHALFGEAA